MGQRKFYIEKFGWRRVGGIIRIFWFSFADNWAGLPKTQTIRTADCRPHCRLCRPHCRLCRPHCRLCRPHCRLCRPHCRLCRPHCRLCRPHCRLCRPHCRLCRPHCRLCRPHCRLCRPHCRLCRPHCRLCRPHCRLCRPHCRLCRPHCRLCRPCRLNIFFFLFSILHLLLTRIFFVSGHEFVFNYISVCLLCTGRACSVCDCSDVL